LKFYFLCFGRHALQYTGLSGFGSKGTLSSLPQSAHVQGYIILSSDIILLDFLPLSTIVLFKKIDNRHKPVSNE